MISLQLSSSASRGPIWSVYEIGGEAIGDRTRDNLALPYPLYINMHPVQDLGPVVGDSDGSLFSLTKYMEGSNFDLRGISDFLSSADPNPNLQCAALQLLEHAAEWQSANFIECVSVTFGPVAKLLDSRNLEVRYAAMDTLKLFLASPHATGIVQPKIPRLVDAVIDNLKLNPEFHLAYVELLGTAARHDGILVEFVAAVMCIPGALSSMLPATQVTALRVLEVCAGSNTPELFKVVTDALQSLIQPLSSPETAVQIAALGVLQAAMKTNDPELAHAVRTILPVLTNVVSSENPNVCNAVREVLEADPQLIHAAGTMSPTLLPLSSEKHNSQPVGIARTLPLYQTNNVASDASVMANIVYITGTRISHQLTDQSY
jgi:hypothetical protein